MMRSGYNESKMKIGRATFLSLTTLAVIVGMLVFPYEQSYAQLLPGPFGGRILDVQSCNCPLPYGKLIIVGPPKEGIFVVIDGILGIIGLGTNVYEYRRIERGNWVLGLSQAIPVPCSQWTFTLLGPTCSEAGVGWYVSDIGTSGVP